MNTVTDIRKVIRAARMLALLFSISALIQVAVVLFYGLMSDWRGLAVSVFFVLLFRYAANSFWALHNRLVEEQER